jgi:hypothetical protein
MPSRKYVGFTGTITPGLTVDAQWPANGGKADACLSLTFTVQQPSAAWIRDEDTLDPLDSVTIAIEGDDDARIAALYVVERLAQALRDALYPEVRRWAVDMAVEQIKARYKKPDA